jgi:hypothetical protein
MKVEFPVIPNVSPIIPPEIFASPRTVKSLFIVASTDIPRLFKVELPELTISPLPVTINVLIPDTPSCISKTLSVSVVVPL